MDTANIHAHDIPTNECIHPETLQLPLRVAEQLTRHIIDLHDPGTGIGGDSIRCQAPLGMIWVGMRDVIRSEKPGAYQCPLGQVCTRAGGSAHPSREGSR